MSKIDISDLIFILMETEFNYAGRPFKPNVIIRDELGKILEENIDYETEYVDNINAGTAHIIITGVGDYEGEVTKDFVINPIDISGYSTVHGAVNDSGCYDISEVVLVPPEGITLTENIDYTRKVSSSRGSGFVYSSVTFTGIDNYTGSVVITLPTNPIIPQSLLELSVYISSYSKTYDGKVFEPDVSIADHTGYELERGMDFTVEYANNLNAGKGTIMVRGMGNFTSFQMMYLTIHRAEIFRTAISCGEPDERDIYDLDNLVIVYEEMQLIKDRDFIYTTSSRRVGRDVYTTLDIKGIGNYSDSIEVTYKTDRIRSDISTLKYTIDPPTWYGGPLEPFVSIYDAEFGQHLRNNEDFSIQYRDNTDVGTAYVHVEALTDDFYGSYEVPFEILPIDLANCDITCGEPNEDGCYDINNIKVFHGLRELEYGFEFAYDVEYETKDFSKFVTVTLRPMCISVIGTNEAIYRVSKFYIDISTLEFSLNQTEFIYNRDIQQPEVITNLIVGEDITIEIPESINPGEYHVVIKGTGTNYLGAIQLTYSIERRTIEDGIVDIGDPSPEGFYDLNVLTLSVDDVFLINTEEFTIFYTTNELEDGYMEAVVTLEGIGYYCGEIHFNCVIAKKTFFAKRKVTLDRAPLYVRSYDVDNEGRKSGIFYLWDGKVVNNRVLVCTRMEACNSVGMITGWVDVSELDFIKPNDYKENEYPAAGDLLKLYRVNVYDTFNANKPKTLAVGNYFVSFESIFNNRIRICVLPEFVGVERKIFGWVNLPDVYIDNYKKK